MSDTAVDLPPIDTGFSRHVDICVSGDDVRPPRSAVKHARNMLGPRARVKWINVAGRGYHTDWMWVMGVPR